MKTFLFMGAALLGLACGTPALAQVLVPGTPATTTGTPIGTPGTTVSPGIGMGQPGTLSATPNALPGSSTLGTMPATTLPGSSSTLGTTLPDAGGTLRASEPATVPRTTRRASRTTTAPRP